MGHINITNKIKFINTEKTTQEITSNTSWEEQGTLVNSSSLVAGNDYLLVAWVNCTSVGTNEGATKLNFEGGSDLVGSAYERHDTNSSGMVVPYIGQFTAPDPTANIVVSRRRLYGSNNELTDYGQAFLIDLSYSGASGSLISGTNYSSTISTASQTLGTNATVITHSVNNDSGTQLIFATSRSYNSTADPSLQGLYINDVLVSSGSRWSQDGGDIKSVVFAIAHDMDEGDTVKIKTLDSHSITADYKYIFTLNIDDSPATKHTGQLSTWYDGESLGGSPSGSWGSATIDGNGEESFVVAMAAATHTGMESGRMAQATLKNLTTDQYLVFISRPSGEYNGLYYPATNYGSTAGEYETSGIVGVGTIGDADAIELQTQ